MGEGWGEGEEAMTERNMFDLTGKVALVTAGGRGLGREFCEAMAQFGADVACNDIDVKRAQETVALLKKYDRRAIALEADVSQPDQVERMVSQTVEAFSTVDILFNNAGIPNPPLRIHELAIADWDKVMDVSLRSMFLVMRAVLPVMLRQRKGSIINTASVAGLMAGSEESSLVNAAPYGTAKHGVIGLTRHAAVAYAKEGIRINAIAPGAHLTWPLAIPREEMEKVNERLARFIPLGRLGTPQDVAWTVCFLASDEAAYITGQVVAVNGGMYT